MPPDARERPRTQRKNTLIRSKHWPAIRRLWLQEHPLCAKCYMKGINRAAEVVDHIIPVRRKPELELEESNFQSLCMKCHSKKTSIEQTQKKAYDYARKVVHLL